MKGKLLLMPFLIFGLMALGLAAYTQLFTSGANAGNDRYEAMQYNRGSGMNKGYGNNQYGNYGYKENQNYNKDDGYKMKGYMKNIPVLPNCPQPGGQLVAGYDNGMHQIPGGPLLSGSDYVWKVGDKLFVQCYCPDKGGKGIQSKWVHESYLNPPQEQYLMSQGWIKIDNGSDWGLPGGTYFVQNRDFFCKDGECKPDYNKKSGYEPGKKSDYNKDEYNKEHEGDKDGYEKNTGNMDGKVSSQPGTISTQVNITNNGDSNTTHVDVQNDVVYYFD